jgi:hypothetical protein
MKNENDYRQKIIPVFIWKANQFKGNNKGVSFPAPDIWHVAVKDVTHAPIK